MSTDDYASGGEESARRDQDPVDDSQDKTSCTSTISLSSSIVVSSRVRLARNIADFPFLNTCSDRQRKEIESSVRKGVDRCATLRGLTIVDSAQLQALERQFVIDLQAVSGLIEEPVKPESQPPGDSEPTPQPAVAGDSRVLLNEEDHLRIQVHRDGLDLHTAWAEANRVDDSIEQHLNFAFNPQWGYLTACPADVGTGMRVSVLLHLPALVMTGKIKEFLRRLKPLNVVGRELFGDPGGDFFRLSNQATLGWNESELIAQVEKAARSVVQAERTARQQLMANEKDKLTYEINVAIEQLLSADLEDTAEENLRQTTRFLSRVRMGIGMELVDQVDTHRVVSKFELIRLRNRLAVAISTEDYQQASTIRDRIHAIEGGLP